MSHRVNNEWDVLSLLQLPFWIFALGNRINANYASIKIKRTENILPTSKAYVIQKYFEKFFSIAI